MNTSIGDMTAHLVGDGSSYQKMMAEAQATTNRSIPIMQAGLSKVDDMAQSIRGFGYEARGTIRTLMGVAGIGFGFDQIFKSVRLAADAEMMESNFKVMLNSADMAKQLVGDLQKFGAETPLNLGDLQGFSKMLLQAGVSANDLIPTLRTIGDVALGDSNKVHQLTYAFGQVKTFGRLMGGELMQLRNAGFDPLQEIARTTGKNMNQLRQEMEAGGISFEMVKNAFKTATGEGGRFKEGMKEASTTLSGLFSTMQDDIDGFQRALGRGVAGQLSLKDAMKQVSEAAQAATAWFESMSDGSKKVITYVSMAAFAIGALTVGISLLGMGIRFVLGGLNPLTTTLILLSSIGVGWLEVYIDQMGGFENAIKGAKEAINAFVDENGRSIAIVLAAAAAVGALVAAYKLTVLAIGIVNGVLAFFHVQQLIGIGLWLAWKVIVLAAQGAMLLFNTVYSITVSLLGAGAAGNLAFGAATLIAKAAVWLLNAALTVTNVLLGGAALIAAIVTIEAIGVALAVVAAGAYAAYQGFKTLFQVLGKIPTDTGPLVAISNIFGEWVEIIKQVVKTASTDLPLAGKLLKAGFELGVAQIAALWPPLWEFVQKGWAAVWMAVSNNMEMSFNQALFNIAGQTLAMFEDIPGVIDKRKILADLDALNAEIAKARKLDIQVAENQLKDAAKGFKFVDTPEIQKAREGVKAVQDEINKAVATAEKVRTGTDPKKEEDNQFKKMTHDIEKMESALFGGAEALGRFYKYQTTLEMSKAAAGGALGAAGGAQAQHGGEAIPAGSPAAIQRVQEDSNKILGDIKSGIDKLNDKPGLSFQTVNL